MERTSSAAMAALLALFLLAAGSMTLASCGDPAPQCIAGAEGCWCGDAGTCQEGLVCDLDRGVCRAAAACDDLGCAEHQQCEMDAAGQDARCLEACDPGFRWNAVEAQCDRGPASCEDGDPNDISADCEAESRLCFESPLGAECAGCQEGFVEIDGACEAVTRCADLDCSARNRACIEAAGQRPAECGDCVEGSREVDGVCMILSCGPVVPGGSVLADCAAGNRVCDDSDEVVRCGACFPGFVDEAGSCRAARSCEDAGCAALGRACVPATDDADASCGACLPGYEDVGGECRSEVGAICGTGPDSIADMCAAALRECVATTDSAECGECLAGYVWNEARGACEEEVTCAELGCAAEHRLCEEEPNGHCTECEPGWVENLETGECREPVACDALTCPDGMECVEGASAEGDAACAPACDDGWVWNGLRCEPCPPCDGTGEAGRWPTPTRAGYCICQTAPGYFYSTGGDLGSVACDADDDGWVRESARTALESTDPALAENARCDLRTIDRFVLENEAGQRREELLRTPLDLYESDRNDDAAILAATWESLGLPASYGTGPDARRPAPEELNRLTKLCHDLRTDYNDNGAFDVFEYGSAPLSPRLRPEQVPFNEHSYFMELYTGYYVAPAAGEPYGSYRIVERPRPSAAPTARELPLTYPTSAGDRWRTCDRERDALYGSIDQLPVGLDFASAYEPPQNPYEVPADFWDGMMHHSQFKCLSLSNAPDPEIPTAVQPNQLGDYHLGRCEAGSGSTALGEGSNAEDPALECAGIARSSVEAGEVAWGLVQYLDHGPWGAGDPAYERGCRNECYARLSGCDGYDTNPESVVCEYDETNFGEFESCRVAEVCDGIDNDDDPGTVDGSQDPRVGQSCEPQDELGICAERGQYDCQASEPYLVCESLVSPFPDELCNGADDDCDGPIDEGDPGNDGSLCMLDEATLDAAMVPEERRNGRCLEGSRGACVDGENICMATYEAQAEVCGNGEDDDCDGAVDESELLVHSDGQQILAGFGVQNQPNCNDYHTDEDEDGWGVQFEKICVCATQTEIDYVDPNSGLSVHAVRPQDASQDGDTTPNFDCCDGNADVHPDSTGYTDRVLTGCANAYDKNCDGRQDQRWTTSGTDGCNVRSVGSNTWTCLGTHCTIPTVGWESSPPACGSTASYIRSGCNCTDGGGVCRDRREQRRQECR